MQKRIFLKLNDTEKRLLQCIAELNGYKDYHTFIHRQIHSLPARIKKDFICDKKETKKAKPIPVNEDILPFLEKLSCSHSTDVTSIIYKYIINPVIEKYMTAENN